MDNTKLLSLFYELFLFTEKEATALESEYFRERLVDAVGVGHKFEHNGDKFVVTEKGLEAYE